MTPEEILQAMRLTNSHNVKKELDRRYKKAQKGDEWQTAFLEELGIFFTACKRDDV